MVLRDLLGDEGRACWLTGRTGLFAALLACWARRGEADLLLLLVWVWGDDVQGVDDVQGDNDAR